MTSQKQKCHKERNHRFFAINHCVPDAQLLMLWMKLNSMHSLLLVSSVPKMLFMTTQFRLLGFLKTLVTSSSKVSQGKAKNCWELIPQNVSYGVCVQCVCVYICVWCVCMCVHGVGAYMYMCVYVWMYVCVCVCVVCAHMCVCVCGVWH